MSKWELKEEGGRVFLEKVTTSEPMDGCSCLIGVAVVGVLVCIGGYGAIIESARQGGADVDRVKEIMQGLAIGTGCGVIAMFLSWLVSVAWSSNEMVSCSGFIITIGAAVFWFVTIIFFIATFSVWWG